MPSVAQQICAARSEGHTSHSAGMHFLAHTSAGTHCADTRARTLQTHILLAHTLLRAARSVWESDSIARRRGILKVWRRGILKV